MKLKCQLYNLSGFYKCMSLVSEDSSGSIPCHWTISSISAPSSFFFFLNDVCLCIWQKSFSHTRKTETTGIPCFAVLLSTAIFTHWRFVAIRSKVYRHHFSNSTAHFMSLSHFDNSYNISNFFIIIVFVTVIFDVAIGIALGCHQTHPYKMVNLVGNCWVWSECSTDQLFLPH